MAVIMISDVPGATVDMMEAMGRAGVLDQLKTAPGFRGHWSGPTSSGYRVIELWERPDDWRAWYDGTIKPKLPPGVEATEPTFIELTMELQPG